MNETIKTILQRRSVRTFAQEQFPDADLDLILQAARFAPTSRNTQMWRFTALRRRETIDRLTQEVKAATSRMKENRYKALVGQETYTVNFGAPTFVIATVHRTNSTSPAADVALALGNMMLAAHSLGLGSCWINQLNVLNEEPEFRKHLTSLNIPQEHDIYGCLTIGIPAKGYPDASPRREGVINILG